MVPSRCTNLYNDKTFANVPMVKLSKHDNLDNNDLIVGRPKIIHFLFEQM